jgi:MFS superfamily sulfate permease-like transporter
MMAMIRKTIKDDFLSGFLVFLIALPLSIGIASASGFPAISGLITATIGGVVAGLLTGAPLTIKGPAAGLIVIALGAVESLGSPGVSGLPFALATIVVAGALQIFLSIIRAGRFSDFFPSSAVHGMLAAIGIIIISKQAHVVLGVTPEAKEPLHLLLEVPASLAKLNPEVALVGLIALVIMFLTPFLTKVWQPLKRMPAPLLVLSVAIPLGILFDFAHSHAYRALGQEYFVGPNFLINVPQNIRDALIHPDFSKLSSQESLKYILMFTLVGSLESLLTVKAIDSITPRSAGRTKSHYDKDLMAVGIGNLLCGFVGGLPMISEVVRSSANLANGAESKYANVFHGVFIAAFVILVPQAIHLVPSAALAGVLIYTGYNLAGPKHWREAWHAGKEQFAVFAVTAFMAFATDLLIGILTGVCLELLINMRYGMKFKGVFKPNVGLHHSEEKTVIRFEEALAFSNLLPVVSTLKTVTARSIELDVRNLRFADHTSVKTLYSWYRDAEANGTQVRVLGFETLRPISKHPEAGRIYIKEVEAQIERYPEP